eukprot:Nk52_evm19s96 gene=Nk52_evmTU19s96
MSPNVSDMSGIPTTGREAIPVTLLSGFLGSGKTTLLKSILEQKDPSMEVAVLVNDMAELNIDAALVKKGNLLQAPEKMVEMQNGCICCTLREDLLLELTKLALMPGKRFDAIVIESTGVSEPQQVAETFSFGIDLDLEDNEGDADNSELNPMYTELKKTIGDDGQLPESLNELARLDTCVTVIDCKAFSGDMMTCATLLERYHDTDKEDDRNISTLLIDQIEFADVILLNKCDLVTNEEALAVERTIKVLNPDAKVHRTVRSKVALESVMQTGLFDMEKAMLSRGWLKSLTEQHVPETEEYGIGSFVYRSRVPFHPKRFDDFISSMFLFFVTNYENGDEEDGEDETNDVEMQDIDKEREEELVKRNEEAPKRMAFMKSKYGNIYRSKGFIWLAGNDKQYGEFSQAGAVASLEYGGIWLGCLPEMMRPTENLPEFESFFKGGNVLFDRAQEIVFIGQDLNKRAITEALDACLLTKEEAFNKVELENSDGNLEEGHSWKFNYVLKDDDPMPVWPDFDKEVQAALEDEEDEHDGHVHAHGHAHIR